MENQVAIGILPVGQEITQDLSKVNLDTLEWPLGKPARLTGRTTSKMLSTDHLVISPLTSKQMDWHLIDTQWSSRIVRNKTTSPKNSSMPFYVKQCQSTGDVPTLETISTSVE